MRHPVWQSACYFSVAMSLRTIHESRFSTPSALLATLFFLTAALPAAAAEAWLPGPDMSLGRYYFALVPLPSGDLLAPGGLTSISDFTNRVDIFSVAGRSFSETAAMPTSHRYHLEAVLLGNGKVLIAGDQAASDARASHLFTEATHSWSSTANPPAISRYGAAMILLPGGNVLYAGGYDGHAGGPTYNSAELFDPASSTWSSTGSMAAQRFGHSLTLLVTGPNAGKVLVTGGGQRIGLTVEARCELYDPATGTFALTGPLNAGRTFHTATRLLDGRVLVTGGNAAGADTSNRDTAEIYDPMTGTWSSAASMATRRDRHTATLLPSGDVLVVGGAQVGSSISVTATAEIYHPATNSWRSAPAMAKARVAQAAALLPSGEVLVAGGYDGASYLKSSEILHGLGTSFFTVTPCRVFDTRDSSPLASGVAQLFPIAGHCGIPASARSVAVSLTALDPTGQGHVVVYPGDAALPGTSSLDFTGGVTRANNAVLALSSDGAGTLAVQATIAGGGETHLLLDVSGYFQ
jgi:hypothetical protein